MDNVRLRDALRQKKAPPLLDQIRTHILDQQDGVAEERHRLGFACDLDAP